MNQIIVVGNLVGDPELRYTASGKAVANATIASDRGRGRDAGTDFLRLTAWEDRVDALMCHKKGASLRVVGSLRTDRSHRDGQTQYFVAVNVREINTAAASQQDIA